MEDLTFLIYCALIVLLIVTLASPVTLNTPKKVHNSVKEYVFYAVPYDTLVVFNTPYADPEVFTYIGEL